MPEREIPLSGGNVNTVVRVGDTVRRVQGPWSRAVQDLLRYLEAAGFDAAPRFLGVDAQGREILSYIAGEIGFPSYVWDDAVLPAVARLLRRFHDTTAGYRPPPGAVWQFDYPDVSRHEVICHNDFAPYNMVFVDGRPAAIIDFDAAGPGPRIWDIAYAVYTFVPLSYAPDVTAHGLADPVRQKRRLRLFCDEYGLADRQDLLATVEQRIAAMCEWLATGAATGDLARRKMVAEGHLAHYQRDLAAFQEHRPLLEGP